MKILTQKQLDEKIKKRNDVFKKATTSQKRVLIAKDVIDQILAKRFNPKRGFWVRFRNERKLEDVVESSLQEKFLDNTIPSCDCCALGGLMMSCTLYNNNEKVGDVIASADDTAGILPFDFKSNQDFDIGFNLTDRRKGFDNGFGKIFSKNQLKLIEMSYEKGRGWFDSDRVYIDSELVAKAIRFGRQHRSNNSRLIAIMKNIVKNNGEFIP